MAHPPVYSAVVNGSEEVARAEFHTRGIQLLRTINTRTIDDEFVAHVTTSDERLLMDWYAETPERRIGDTSPNVVYPAGALLSYVEVASKGTYVCTNCGTVFDKPIERGGDASTCPRCGDPNFHGFDGHQDAGQPQVTITALFARYAQIITLATTLATLNQMKRNGADMSVSIEYTLNELTEAIEGMTDR